MKLYHKVGPGEKIKYLDLTSLYPTVHKYDEYPIGHPEVILENFWDITEYFGLAKVKILPPRSLYHPVGHIATMESSCFPCVNLDNH